MAARKKTAKRRMAPARKTAKGLAITWEGTREAFGNAENAVERRVRTIVKEGTTRSQQATEALAGWRTRLERERRKALKQVQEQLNQLQTRARRERKMLARAVDETVQSTLAALNIPSRQEIQELTRRVEELSRKIDGFRRGGAAPRRVRVTKATVTTAAQA
jgi:poly(hydroxyalkanoate) granule-associated protein